MPGLWQISWSLLCQYQPTFNCVPKLLTGTCWELEEGWGKVRDPGSWGDFSGDSDIWAILFFLGFRAWIGQPPLDRLAQSWFMGEGDAAPCFLTQCEQSLGQNSAHVTISHS